MKLLVCSKCNYTEKRNNLEDNYVCPNCGSNKSFFHEREEFSSNEIDAIIDSVLEDVMDVKSNKIINEDKDEKSIIISKNNESIQKNSNKCINCGQCKKTCENLVNISYNLNNCKDPICIGCGQCILNCPTGAITSKSVYHEVKSLIDENKKIVIAVVSPGVYTSIGEIYGIEKDDNYQYKIVSALKKIGFDYVFDTGFGSDLNVLEEVAEFAERLSKKGHIPLFSSNCPSWTKYAQIYHPELLDNISTCRNPISMQCEIIKEYFASKKGFDSSKIITVAITPCTALKIKSKENGIDYSMTSSELALLLAEKEIILDEMQNEEFDELVSESSACGNIYETSGGVVEAVIKTLYRILTKNNISEEEMTFKNIRGLSGIKEATIPIGKYNLRVAVVQQLENLEKLLENDRYKKYHYIEVMNCKGSCTGGGGHILHNKVDIEQLINKRSESLYKLGIKNKIKIANDNLEIAQLYKEYLTKPLDEKSVKILHTSYTNKENLLKNK